MAKLTPFGRNEICTSHTFDFRTGDFVTARVKSLPFILHRGIVVVDNGCVNIYHNTPMYHNAHGGSLVKENIQEWLKSRDITSIVPTSLTQDTIETTANNLSNRKFNLFTFNCEQFAFLLKDGKPRSPQLIGWGIALSVLGYFLSNK